MTEDMTNWIDSQVPEMACRWIKETSVPLLVTVRNGTLLWCNEAFEEFVGYTVSELRGMEDCWQRLTIDQGDATYDSEMAEMVESRERYDYRFRKKYISKDGVPRPCEIHVLRHPEAGSFEYFLVSVLPLDLSYGAMLEELQLLQRSLLDLSSKPDMWERMMLFYKSQPKTAIVVTIVLSYLLFGDRVIDLIERGIKVMSGLTNAQN